MSSIEVNQEFVNVGLWIVAALISLIVLRKFIHYLRFRVIDGSNHRVFAITDSNKNYKIVTGFRILWNPFEYVERGKEIAERFVVRSTHENGTVTSVPLMDAATGEISTIRSVFTLPEFTCSTYEGLPIATRATLTFSLDPETLEDCFRLANLGEFLEIYVREFIDTEIRQRDPRSIAREEAQIEEAVRSQMSEARNGVVAHRVFIQTRVLKSQSSEKGSSDFDFDLNYLRQIREMFKPKSGGSDLEVDILANQATLNFIELWTQRMVAKELSQSSATTIVLPGEDVSLAKNAVFRNKLGRGAEPWLSYPPQAQSEQAGGTAIDGNSAK